MSIHAPIYSFIPGPAINWAQSLGEGDSQVDCSCDEAQAQVASNSEQSRRAAIGTLRYGKKLSKW